MLFRSYKRGILYNKEWADVLFQRILRVIPEHFQVESCNECFRFSDYGPAGEFKIHRDGFNVDSKGRRSVITVNIFLNDDFSGGSTDFYFDDKKTLRQSVSPKIGRAAIFDSQQYHTGCKVDKEHKYLLRTDVMRSIS